jgi:cellulose synthase/poly-beta-1,6-N-acetylglucosamine synthase-like glycosyltransferase
MEILKILEFLIFLVGVGYILIQCWQTITLIRYRSINTDYRRKETELPTVTVLVACRNEEHNIENCLRSLIDLNYPKEKLKILVGNDQSEDNTLKIARQFECKYDFIQVIDIQEDSTGLKAKARVMAQLDKHAVGDYYLVTDADVCVNSNWILGLLSNMNEEIGVASGTTMVKSNGIGGLFQEIDWAYFMGLLNVISYSGVPATAVGNNMIIRKDAYWQTGGYSKIRFSITEDYKLYKEVCDKGWKWNNIMNNDVLGYSEKTNGFIPLLHQRKRWLSGGKELPWYWWILFGIYGAYYFVSVALVLIFLLKFPVDNYLLLIPVIKWGLQSIQIIIIYRHLSQKPPNLLKLIIYEFYLTLITISTAIFFVLPVKTNWKDRKY